MAKAKKEALKTLTRCLHLYNDPHFHDITPMFSDSVPFLVSGEMLLLTALMDPNYNNLLGGQSLHMIYICERLLNVFAKNNGTFEIVFFDVWKNVFDDWHLLLYRQITIAHFKNNTTIPVHCFGSVYDAAFSELIDKVRPGFFAYNLASKCLYELLGQYGVSTLDFLSLFCGEFIFCLKADLPIVDLGTINVQASTVYSYRIENDIDYKLLPDLQAFVSEVSKLGDDIKTVTAVYKCKDIREYVICNAVTIFLNSFPERTNDARLFLLYATVLENLKLQNRGTPRVEVTDSEIEEDVFVWQKIMFLLLNDASEADVVWKNIGDIWQGTLLAVVYSSVTEEVNRADLGQFAGLYEQYIDKISSRRLTAYPIQPLKNQFCNFTMPYCRRAGNVACE